MLLKCIKTYFNKIYKTVYDNMKTCNLEKLISSNSSS